MPGADCAAHKGRAGPVLAAEDGNRRDAATAASAVLRAVSEGDLTPTEGAHVMQLVETYRRTLELSDVEARIVALEEAS